jgi:sirohydrochlorin cobaltochelatase
MKPILVLAMHGAPPTDYPREELSEFFGLHARREHAGKLNPPALEARYAELEKKMRSWPRTAENDPFYAGSKALADSLEAASGYQVLLGFNEFCAPSLGEALDQAAAGTDRVVVITPMMTRGGEHSEVEIPQEVSAARSRHPGVAFHYIWPLDLDEVASFLSAQIEHFLDRD